MFAAMKGNAIFELYQSLLRTYGEQSWWPAESAFEVMVGAILTQNTAWSNVEKAISNLKISNVLNAQSILQTPADKLAEIIRPSGYFNVKTKRLKSFCHWYLQQGGYDALSTQDTESLRQGLLAVNGIGPETADDMLLYAFHRPVFVIDTYTRRLFTRTGCADGQAAYDELRIQVEQSLASDVKDMNEFHALIVHHAKDNCKVKPVCHSCVINNNCSHANDPGKHS